MTDGRTAREKENEICALHLTLYYGHLRRHYGRGDFFFCSNCKRKLMVPRGQDGQYITRIICKCGEGYSPSPYLPGMVNRKDIDRVNQLAKEKYE